MLANSLGIRSGGHVNKTSGFSKTEYANSHQQLAEDIYLPLFILKCQHLKR
jgi:hypothetical protein